MRMYLIPLNCALRKRLKWEILCYVYFSTIKDREREKGRELGVRPQVLGETELSSAPQNREGIHSSLTHSLNHQQILTPPHAKNHSRHWRPGIETKGTKLPTMLEPTV